MAGRGSPSDTGFYYYPEYTAQLGSPMAPPPAQLKDLQVGNVYQRDFQNGIVIVNASASAATATLPAGETLYRITPVGGGSVNDTNINADGSLTTAFMSLASQAASGTITINAWSSAILLNSAP